MLPISKPTLPPLADYIEALEDIWHSRMLSNFGKYANRFERDAQGYIANPNARAVVSCDVGLTLSIAALGLPDGSDCIVPSFTFNSTVNAVLWNRMRPRFVDIDPETFNVDVRDLERLIGADTRAILVTHVFGSPLDVDAVMDLANRHGLPVVVDAAHCYGGSYRGRRIGHPSLGTFQVFSFSGTKQVTSAEGGLIASDTKDRAEAIEYLRGYGFKYDYISKYVGMNGKLSELHAALAALALPGTDSAIARRNELADRYRAALRHVESITFQRHLAETLVAYKDFAIVCRERRDELSVYLDSLGIQTKQYFRPLHRMPAYSGYLTGDEDLADTEHACNRVLCLPMFNEMRDEDVDFVAGAIAEFYG